MVQEIKKARDNDVELSNQAHIISVPEENKETLLLQSLFQMYQCRKMVAVTQVATRGSLYCKLLLFLHPWSRVFFASLV